MKEATTTRLCAFCGSTGNQDTRYAAGYGVLIDEECVEHFAEAMAKQATGEPSRDGDGWASLIRRRPMEELSNQEMLDTLPRIASSGAQVNRFMAGWVESIRERKLSWTAIGNAMGISRQAAWERFTRVLGSERNSGTR